MKNELLRTVGQFIIVFFIFISNCESTQIKDGTRQIKNIKKVRNMYQGITGRVNEEFWKPIHDDEKSQIIDKIIDSDTNGIVIDAPAMVNILNHSTLPIFGFRKSSGYESYHYRLESSLLVYAFSYMYGTFYCKDAFFQKESPIPVTPIPENEFLKGFTVGDFFIDLKERIPDIFRQEDEIDVGVLLFDKRSNSLSISLIANPDNKVKVVKKKASNSTFESLKKYQIEDNKLNKESMEISCNRDLYSVVDHKNIDLLIKFNFGPNQMYELVKPAKIGIDTHGHFEVAEKIVRVYLLFTGYDVPGPWISTLDIPVPEENYDYFIGSAEFDISSNLPMIPQKYAFWVFTKNCSAGPLYFTSASE